MLARTKSLGSLDQFVGSTSIVRSLRTILNEPGEPRLFSLASVPNSFLEISGVEMAGSTGAMAETWENAAISAVGECVERYCCAVQPPDLIFASAAELGARAYPLETFELFAEQQYSHPDFPFVRQTESLSIPGVEMTDYRTVRSATFRLASSISRIPQCARMGRTCLLSPCLPGRLVIRVATWPSCRVCAKSSIGMPSCSLGSVDLFQNVLTSARPRCFQLGLSNTSAAAHSLSPCFGFRPTSISRRWCASSAGTTSTARLPAWVRRVDSMKKTPCARRSSKRRKVPCGSGI